MMCRTYDSWKAHNPADEELGSCLPESDGVIEPSDEEFGTDLFAEKLRTQPEEDV